MMMELYEDAYWYVQHESKGVLTVINNTDSRLYKCYDTADAVWPVGLLNKLENEK